MTRRRRDDADAADRALASQAWQRWCRLDRGWRATLLGTAVVGLAALV